jgi:hypothetical protein
MTRPNAGEPEVEGAAAAAAGVVPGWPPSSRPAATTTSRPSSTADVSTFWVSLPWRTPTTFTAVTSTTISAA